MNKYSICIKIGVKSQELDPEHYPTQCINADSLEELRSKIRDVCDRFVNLVESNGERS